MYAYDIACVKWRSFDVFAPQLFLDYRVRVKGFDERLGNYIVLENWNTWFLFAHVTSWLERGDIVGIGDRIWEVDLSWKATNYHLHFEIWENDYNISIKKYLEGNIVKNTEHTYALRKQRGFYIGEAEAMDFIADFEGFRECAYEDGKQISIWFWTRASSIDECITREEGKKRKMGHVEMLYEHIYENLSFLETHNQRLAMTSALYNLWVNSGIQNIEWMSPEQMEKHWNQYKKSSICWWVCRWLEKRRNIEIIKFNQ